MTLDLPTRAVRAALNNEWPEAIRLNLTLLKEDSQNIEALNRLARAYKESGNFKLAQENYKKVIRLDHFNTIASKNLNLLESLPKNFKSPKHNDQKLPGNHCQPQTFLEEPGKTKVINLVNLAPNSVLFEICCGDKINLLVKRRAVVAHDTNGTYLGALPDDLSLKLIKRLYAGNRYESFIKTVGKNSLSVFIREIFRSPRFKNQPTFPGACGEYYLGKMDSTGAEEETTETEEVVSEEETSL